MLDELSWFITTANRNCFLCDLISQLPRYQDEIATELCADWISSAHDALANRERDGDPNKSKFGNEMHQRAASPADLYERDSLPEYAARAHSIMSLHRDSRTLLRSDTALPVVAATSLSSLDTLGNQRSLTIWSLGDSSIILADFIMHSIVRFRSDSLDSIKDHLAEKLHERERRRTMGDDA